MDTQVDRDKLPPGGIEGLLQLVEHPGPDERSDLDRLQDAQERDFQVTGLLARSLALTARITAGLDGLSGSSFFKPPAGSSVLREARAPDI